VLLFYEQEVGIPVEEAEMSYTTKCREKKHKKNIKNINRVTKALLSFPRSYVLVLLFYEQEVGTPVEEAEMSYTTKCREKNIKNINRVTKALLSFPRSYVLVLLFYEQEVGIPVEEAEMSYTTKCREKKHKKYQPGNEGTSLTHIATFLCCCSTNRRLEYRWRRRK